MFASQFYPIVTLLLLEIFEGSWQKGKNFNEYLSNLLSVYKKGVIVFIAMHPGFYYVIFIAISRNNFSFLISLVLMLKALDIAMKISILQKLEEKKDIGFFKAALGENLTIPPYIKCLGAFAYPTLVYFAFSP